MKKRKENAKVVLINEDNVGLQLTLLQHLKVNSIISLGILDLLFFILTIAYSALASLFGELFFFLFSLKVQDSKVLLYMLMNKIYANCT